MKGPQAENVLVASAPVDMTGMGGMGAMGGMGGEEGNTVQPGQIYYGKIKSYNEVRGWGHIICDETKALYGRDMFMLRSTLAGQPAKAGDQVSFSVIQGQKGPEAVK